MLVQKIHPFTGEKQLMDLPVTQEQLDRFAAGEHAQHVFIDCTADQREFIISGIPGDEFDELCKEE